MQSSDHGAENGRAQANRLAAACWRLIKLTVRRALEVALALIVLFEEWGWRPLAELAARLAQWRPWARLEAGIASLPPYAALVAFGAPSLLLVPVKLAALWLIAKGHVVLAGGVFLAAKVIGTALVARIFQLTQPALMRLAWFARAYGIVVPWKAALITQARASWAWRMGRIVKERARRRALLAWMRLRPRLEPMRREVRRLAAGMSARFRAALRR